MLCTFSLEIKGYISIPIVHLSVMDNVLSISNRKGQLGSSILNERNLTERSVSVFSTAFLTVKTFCST